jgi:4-aminobutyrate aminotransferase
VSEREQSLSPSMRLPFPPLLLEGGVGATLRAADGRTFLDFHAMAAIANTGHNHPAVVAAIQEQAARLVHVNPAYALHAQPLALAEALAARMPGPGPWQVALGLSGSDANDGAIKLARAATGRSEIIAFEGSYHGNTYGALSLSAVTPVMRRGFGPVVPGIHHVPYPDPYRGPDAEQCLDALDRLLATSVVPEEVAAVVFEPIQGDAGVIVPPQSYVDGLVARCRQHGILLVAEEVQTGVARTGPMWACEHLGLVPDMLLAGKALGSGMPVSAIVARAELMDAWQAPGHVFCTGANPICCAAANATLAIVDSERLGTRAERLGARLQDGLRALADRHEAIGDVRGRGLMIGCDLVRDRATRERSPELASQVLVGCYSRGLFLTFLGGNVLRFVPPLIIDEEDVDRCLEIVAAALDDALAGRVDPAEAAAMVGW